MSGERELPTFLWDVETNRTIHDALPDLVIDFFALVTRLGDGATVVALAIIFYWFGRRWDWEKRGMLMAIAVATLALSAGLKGVLDVSRPLSVANPPLEFAPEAYDGLSTPSAHAMGAAAIYGGLAVLMDVGKRWQRYLVAGAIIICVAFSRVVIGVHFLGDVLLGVALGLGLVWLAVWLSGKLPRSVMPMFLFAFLVASIARPLGSEEFVTMSLGTALGGLVVWSFIHDRDPEPIGGAIVLFAILLIPALVGFRVVEALVTLDILLEIAGAEVPVMAGIRIIGYALLFGLALGVPVIAERFNEHPHALWIQDTLPFRGRVVDPELVEERIEQLGD